MFLKYANLLDDNAGGYMNKNVPLQINSCGTYRLLKRKKLETCRPEGRNDYQLIYISSGSGYFYFDNMPKETVIEAGNIILYRPNDYQKYEYYSKDHAEVYWIHFTGNEIESVFSSYGLDVRKKVFACGTDALYRTNFEMIINEMEMKKDYFDDVAAFLFKQILISVGRYQKKTSPENPYPNNEIEEIMSYFRAHYQENINVEKYIESQGYSISSFFRKFKEYTEMTPLQYILHIRLSCAMKLLETSTYQVGEISKIVGYDNQLYFSRLFHKHIGMSPNNYRKNIVKPTP